ncbi:MAG: DUF4082 domain-containing protein [Planctomycetes bacterium]|nr:DUF4082 domain-containing protein [Planctomycetota bacterium]
MMRKLIVSCVVFALCAVAANAQDAAILGFTGGTEYSSYYSVEPGDTIGWTFMVNDPIVVTDLGHWIDTHNGMDNAHDVGIWDMSQNLLASVVVDPNTAYEYNGWMYQAISPLALTAGESYVIGSFDGVSDDDWYISGASTLDDAPEITWVNSRYPTVGGLGFAFPELTSTSRGRFGPNFLYVPEPSAVALLSLGGLVLLRRR